MLFYGDHSGTDAGNGWKVRVGQRMAGEVGRRMQKGKRLGDFVKT